MFGVAHPTIPANGAATSTPTEFNLCRSRTASHEATTAPSHRALATFDGLPWRGQDLKVLRVSAGCRGLRVHR